MDVLEDKGTKKIMKIIKRKRMKNMRILDIMEMTQKWKKYIYPKEEGEDTEGDTEEDKPEGMRKMNTKVRITDQEEEVITEMMDTGAQQGKKQMNI